MLAILSIPLLYVQNADTPAGADEARTVLKTRFVIAQLLAVESDPSA